jgi:hypothetical protein
MKTQIEFLPNWTVEQRKSAINNAMQSRAPFRLKRMLMSLPGIGISEYTGGFTQMLLARSITLEYEKP